MLLATLAIFLAGSWRARQSATTQLSSSDRLGDNATSAEGTIFLPLFYVAENGMSLVAAEQALPVSADDDRLARARIIIERQLADPPEPLASPFPDGTELRAVYVTPDGNAFVDLNIDVTREHGGGSLDELFTVYALVNALTTNVSEIRSVQILVEGREVDTLAGHIDLRHPLERNMKWVAQPNSDGVE